MDLELGGGTGMDSIEVLIYLDIGRSRIFNGRGHIGYGDTIWVRREKINPIWGLGTTFLGCSLSRGQNLHQVLSGEDGISGVILASIASVCQYAWLDVMNTFIWPDFLCFPGEYGGHKQHQTPGDKVSYYKLLYMLLLLNKHDYGFSWEYGPFLPGEGWIWKPVNHTGPD